MIYKSQFKKNDIYDRFCGHIYSPATLLDTPVQFLGNTDC